MNTEASNTEVYTVELPEHGLLKDYMQYVAELPERNNELLLSKYMARQHTNSLNEDSTVTGTEYDLMTIYREICGGLLATAKIHKTNSDESDDYTDIINLTDCAWRVLFPFDQENARKLRDGLTDFIVVLIANKLFGEKGR